MLPPPSTTASLHCLECSHSIKKNTHISHHFNTPHIIYRSIYNNSIPIPGPVNICTKIEPIQDQNRPKLHINTATMASTNNTSQWEAPKFSFSRANQAKEWKPFYFRALSYLETLDTNVDIPDQTKIEYFITVGIYVASSVNQDVLNTQCTTYRNSQPPANCPAYGKVL